MALYTAAMHTYDAIGNREDLIDVITNIAGEEARRQGPTSRA